MLKRMIPTLFPCLLRGRARPAHRGLLTLIVAAGALSSSDCLIAAEPAPEREAIVAVATVTREDLAKELSVQAELRPYQEIDLHAKIAGYLKRMSVEIGDHVKAGDPIAVLEVPELKEDVAKAQGALQRAEANYKEAHLNYTRLQSVSRGQPNLLAQQEVDVAQTKEASAAASVTEAKAELEKLRVLESYTRITAPFDGVITKRYADPGALIQAGTNSSTQAMPLVRLSQNDKLRLVFPVSVSYARMIKVGDAIDVDFGDREKRHLAAINRFNRRISSDTRTMLVETDLENPKLDLIPGMYLTVVLKIERRPQALAVPVEAVAGTKQPSVYVINAEKKIEERMVKLGIETPTKWEVLSGVKAGELVMIGNRAQVRVGQKVTTKMVELLAGQ
jgi:RND family efflux transporter MFP subunit